MLVFKRSFFAVVLAIALTLGMYFLGYVPTQYLDIAINAMFGGMALFVMMAIAALLIGWLEYSRYGIFMNEKDIRVRRGLFAVEEVGIPYRRIKDVKIERSLADQLFGLSQLIIMMVEGESQVILPSLDKQIALQIQDAILKKSQVEDINVLANSG